MGMFKKLMKMMKKEKSMDSELEKLLSSNENEELEEEREEDFGDIEEFGTAGEDDEFGAAGGEETEDYSKYLQNISGQNWETEPEKRAEKKVDEVDLFKSSFEDELLDELKKEDLSNAEEQYSILKILDGDVSAEELAGELREILHEVRQC